MVISVAIIDDNRLAREGLSALLAGTGRCSVVAAAADSDVARLEAAEPEVVLLDLARNGDGLRAVERERRQFPDAALVVMDLVPRQEDIMAFVNAGAAGFVMKDATVDELLSTIVAVAAGRHVLPPEMTTALFSQIAREGTKSRRNGTDSRQEEPQDAARLTPREREVILLIKEGLSNKRIAARLGIAPQTVKSHVRNVMEKLALHTRLQISAYGRAQNGAQDL
jgi:two-component system, NarL family, nitrate/nitrite response regulator NarL